MINVPDIAVVDMTEVTVLGTVVVSLVDTIEVLVVLVIGTIEVEGIGVTIMLVDTVEAIHTSDITAYYWVHT